MDHYSRPYPLPGASLAQLTEELQRRCATQRQLDAATKLRLRNDLLKQAGGLTYDQVAAEFGTLARKLGWPPAATPKDFRHLFSTCLENAGMPEHYRQYLMGHSPGKSPINSYTHLNKIHAHYQLALQTEFQPLVEAWHSRLRQLA